MATKKNTYKPDAIDADGDGLVQDGTEFERPVGTELALEQDIDSEAVEGTSETVTPVLHANTYVVADGDSYASLAAAFCPLGMPKHDYAVYLYEINRGKRLNPGVEVIL